MLGHKNIIVCEISDAYLLRCLRHREKHGKDILIIIIAVGVFVVYKVVLACW